MGAARSGAATFQRITVAANRSIVREEIPVGQRLPGDLHDAEGLRLHEAGTCLAESAVEAFPALVWVDGAWPARAPASRVVDGLYERLDQPNPTAEGRAHDRRPWAVTLKVVIAEALNHHITTKQATVVTIDLSRGGFSFVYPQFVHHGSVVAARFNMLPGHPVLYGSVRNCVLLDGLRHRVGVAFDDEASDDQGQDVP